MPLAAGHAFVPAQQVPVRIIGPVRRVASAEAALLLTVVIWSVNFSAVKIGLADIRDALVKGIDDFSAMPTHVLFLGVLYPLIGLFLAFLTFGYEVVPLLFPLASGFALVGLFAALGLYELSRRREQGLDSSWTNAFDVVRSPSRDASVVCAS